MLDLDDSDSQDSSNNVVCQVVSNKQETDLPSELEEIKNLEYDHEEMMEGESFEEEM